jgi:hypothetical protein
LLPHADAVGVVQWPVASQQPLGHEVASHTHAPDTHRCPAPHAAPPPQVQAPAVQPSVALASQAAQAAPGAPHADALVVTHCPPLQQPVGHDVASHTQAPATQRWPASHARCVPQAQVPLRHASLRVGSQARQVLPPVPQLPAAEARQVALSQQPVGHEVASHTQLPERQRCPAPQAGPVPQPHAPSTQPSATFVSHTPQSSPGLPQAVTDSVVQAPPRQQPLGQLVAEQISAPSPPSGSASLVPSASAPSPLSGSASLGPSMTSSEAASAASPAPASSAPSTPSAETPLSSTVPSSPPSVAASSTSPAASCPRF